MVILTLVFVIVIVFLVIRVDIVKVRGIWNFRL